ncbi:MAG TPA: hypothetical protein VLJ57_20860 [Burkholderiaceae bacterium]|nr:hypothetical protein [Burkholderiaceae bacterium]
MPFVNSANTSTAAAPAVLDIEASGFGRNSYPIEVGYVLANGEAFCTLIRPEPEWTHWDPEAERLHHIPRELVLSRGLPAADVARMLNARLDGQTLYSDGWANDYSWLGALFEVAELAPGFRIENLRALLCDGEAERWHAVKQQISKELGMQRHRASTDARVLQLTLQRLRTLSEMH